MNPDDYDLDIYTLDSNGVAGQIGYGKAVVLPMIGHHLLLENKLFKIVDIVHCLDRYISRNQRIRLIVE